MSKTNRRWITPQLIVLARGTPEESVLYHCKRIEHGVPATGPNVTQQTACNDAIGSCGNCAARAKT